MKREDSDEIKLKREERKLKFSKLHDFKTEYTADQLLADLAGYFDNEIDFDLKKLRIEASRPGVLKSVVEAALKNNTHPVSEFLKHIVKSSAKE
jgi:predicted P-loop ATPase